MTRRTQYPKKEVLDVLRRAHVPEATIEAIDKQVGDPVDVRRDSQVLLQHGITRDELVSRMGGSP